ncbi:MAG TPA: hypothetical protein PLG50_03360 [bacterium]|nr:hypothetical protein [bacterium]HQG44680.1 hypothetical protein [bacterium]HQI49061.1 hypothetical protein [bacterium]HQJ65210.1 hypothetical protein [bacterium]
MKRFTFMIISALTIFLLAGAVDSAQAHGRYHRHIRIAPPAPRVIAVRPASPFRFGIWVEGYWDWNHGHYVWIDGRWIEPRSGHEWVAGRWVRTRQGWDWIPGHWHKVRMPERFRDRDGYARAGRDGQRDQDYDRDRNRDGSRDKDRNRDRDRQGDSGSGRGSGR